MSDQQTDAINGGVDQLEEQQESRSRRDHTVEMRRVIEQQARELRELRNIVTQKPEEPEPQYSREDPVDIGILEQKLSKAEQRMLKKLEPIIDHRIKQREMADYINSAPDYLDVINQYSDLLEKHYPRTARLLKENPEEGAVAAYEMIVNAPFYKKPGEERRKPAPQKAPEPPSGLSGGVAPLAQANGYQHMEIGEDLWNKFCRDTGYTGTY
jgi:hypothetical protein